MDRKPYDTRDLIKLFRAIYREIDPKQSIIRKKQKRRQSRPLFLLINDYTYTDARTIGIGARTDNPKEDPVNIYFLTQSPQISAEVFLILDTRASRHIYNDKSRFISLEPYEITLATGDSSTEVIIRGTVKLIGRNPKIGKKRVISLSNILYSPGFHTNLCQKSNYIINTDNRPIYESLAFRRTRGSRISLYTRYTIIREATRSEGFSKPLISLFRLPVAYNSHRWISHFVIKDIRFHWISTHELKSSYQLAINQFV
ncbi:hypothetical protein N7476_003703 [Penicillium atrosanguineum]|uniref:Retrovirus-related Pol polyprotein from transposon TNT 1-94-like beta-barrel domain-containing protein n=1 Tax=Penicillium atrosanguineum TaxID=1132637 RepID=A0A9W9Q7F9_9EURO|nr:hypothetical protein N7476_003703 [Penicillium atrosanguineum]